MYKTQLAATRDEDGGKMVGAGVDFERIRRITGYLVGSLERFNNGKRSEEHDRLKHSTAKIPDVGGNNHGENTKELSVLRVA